MASDIFQEQQPKQPNDGQGGRMSEQTELDQMRQERDEARLLLAQCYVLSGADTDGNEPGSGHLWPDAVDAVRQLAQDYDDEMDVDSTNVTILRLQRMLALELGDSTQAPKGWRKLDYSENSWGKGDTIKIVRIAQVRLCGQDLDSPPDVWVCYRTRPGAKALQIGPQASYALDLMEAIDKEEDHAG